eukprot:1160671-Pelagomonas_calceolata.AAC.6
MQRPECRAWSCIAGPDGWPACMCACVCDTGTIRRAAFHAVTWMPCMELHCRPRWMACVHVCVTQTQSGERRSLQRPGCRAWSCIAGPDGWPACMYACVCDTDTIRRAAFLAATWMPCVELHCRPRWPACIHNQESGVPCSDLDAVRGTQSGGRRYLQRPGCCAWSCVAGPDGWPACMCACVCMCETGTIRRAAFYATTWGPCVEPHCRPRWMACMHV